MPPIVGQYTEVYVYPVQAQSGSLSKGTGTYTAGTNFFSCGDFDNIDLPDVGDKYFYKITAKDPQGKSFELAGVHCTLSGATSEFTLS